MVYRSGYNPKGNEILQLQSEITNEIARDGPAIAQGVFGNNARHPDMTSVSNTELDQVYRNAYLKGDRQFLMQEAQRDPHQFLAVTDRLGVQDPPTNPMNGKPTGVPPDALAKALSQPAAQSAQAAPSPPALPQPSAVPPPGVPPVVTSAPVAPTPVQPAPPPPQIWRPGMP